MEHRRNWLQSSLQACRLIACPRVEIKSKGHSLFTTNPEHCMRPVIHLGSLVSKHIGNQMANLSRKFPIHVSCLCACYHTCLHTLLFYSIPFAQCYHTCLHTLDDTFVSCVQDNTHTRAYTRFRSWPAHMLRIVYHGPPLSATTLKSPDPFSELSPEFCLGYLPCSGCPL